MYVNIIRRIAFIFCLLLWTQACICFNKGIGGKKSIFKFDWFSPNKPKSGAMPVSKTSGEPVLTVIHPLTGNEKNTPPLSPHLTLLILPTTFEKTFSTPAGSKVTLIGVSHGSAASSALVESVLRDVKPDAVVVELCEDRLMSISVEAKIKPVYNATLNRMYSERLREVEEKRKQLEASGNNKALYNALNTARFVKKQGLFGGVFVMLGLLISYVQKTTRDVNRGLTI